MKIIQTPSPNFDTRAEAIQYIVLHYTGMKTLADAHQRLLDPNSKVSAHYLIAEDGEIVQLVKESDRAWHAGRGYWHGTEDMNSASIGIELENPGHEFGYRPFPEKQIAALRALLLEIIARHTLDPRTAIIAHSDYAPDRKEDPGEFFPWDILAQDGLGLWPTEKQRPEFIDPEGCRDRLTQIGYNPALELHSLLTAFQRRTKTAPTDGILTPETAAMLSFFANYDKNR